MAEVKVAVRNVAPTVQQTAETGQTSSGWGAFVAGAAIAAGGYLAYKIVEGKTS